jgi:hydroxyacylglutathione hydrolase
VKIVPLSTPNLGDRTYLAHDGAVGVVVDAQRDIDRVLQLAEDEGVRIGCVAETHIHNDYVTGGLALARETGADYLVCADDPVGFERRPVRDGDLVEVGEGIHLRAVATPGHTHTHLSFVVSRNGDVAGVFTGGSLLYGATGRPDLLGPDHTHRLVREQHASAHRLAGMLPDPTPVFPTHGFGSFCSSQQSDVDASTIGRERESNTALTLDVESYARDLLAGLDAFPCYYAHMAPANLSGPAAADLTVPPPADAEEIRRRLAAGEWVVDIRGRRAYAAAHARGSFNVELDGSLATYLGWLIPWGTPVTLVAEDPAALLSAQRELARIDISPVAVAAGPPTSWSADLCSYECATFTDLELARQQRDVLVLDVRREDERRESAVPGSQHLPIHELSDRIREVPSGVEVWVHCATGMRAAIAASILDAAGRTVCLLDDEYDEVAGWAAGDEVAG